MRYRAPLEIQTLHLQQIAYRTGWELGKRENLHWAIQVLRNNGHSDAADFLESLFLGKAIRGIEQATRFQPSQHPTGNQASKVETPTTAVEWPGEKPSSHNASHHESS